VKKGIIMEVDKRFLTVLTPEGEFLRARNDSSYYQIGQEITFIPVTQEVKKKAPFLTFFRGRFLLPSAAALMLAFLFFIPFYQNNQVYAYLSIDINPSIELGINKKYEVIELKSYNADGEKIINQIHDWKHKEIDNVVEHLVGEIKKQGYMKNKQKMVVATVYAKEDHPEKDKQLKQEMKQITELVTTENLDLTVVEGTQTEREKAMTEGLTTGLYKEKKLKKQKAKSEAERKVKQAEDKVNSIPVEMVPTVQEEKIKNAKEKNPNIPPGQIKKSENQVKNKEKQVSKEEKQQIRKEEKQVRKEEIKAENDKRSVDGKQGNPVTVPPIQETSKNQNQNNHEVNKQEKEVQKPQNQEPENWGPPKHQNNNKEHKHDDQKNQNRNNVNNGNNGNGNEHHDAQTGRQGNNPHANNGNGNKKDEH
jgi:hypothetical protein